MSISPSQCTSCASQGMSVAVTTPSLQNPIKTVQKYLCTDQSHMLLKQQLFQTTHQLQLLKIHNQNLLSQIAELKQKQQQMKHLNQVILQNLNSKQQQTSNNEIKLKIEGQFLNNRIKQLQQELYNYRNGVCDSVDRRVKKIVGEFTQQQELQNQKRSQLQEQIQSNRRRSRVGLSPTNNNTNSNSNKQQRQNQYYQTHQHKYYNIEYNNYINSSRLSPNEQLPQQSSSQDSISQPYTVSFTKTTCEKCVKLQQIINDQREYIESLENKIKQFIQIKSMTKGNELLGNNSGDVQQQQQQQLSPIINNGNSVSNGASSSAQLVDEWKLKYLQLLKLYQNLKQQHQLFLSPNPNHNHKDEQQQHFVVTQLSPLTGGFKKKQQLFNDKNSKPLGINNPSQSRFYKEDRDNRETEMLQQITNLVNGLGKNNKGGKHQLQEKAVYCYQKVADKKSRISQMSRVSLASNNKLDGSVFTIKQGVNRYNTNNPFF